MDTTVTSKPAPPEPTPAPSPATVIIPESSQRVQTILLRVYRSLQLCAPFYFLAVLEPGSLWYNRVPNTPTVVSTVAFGAAVGIITNRDLARKLAIQYGAPLAGDGSTHPPNPTPFVARRSVIAWAYVTALFWVYHVGFNTFVNVVDVVHGYFWVGRMVGMVVLLAVGGLQVVLLVSIGMLGTEERREVAERGTVKLPTEDEVVE